MFIQWYISSKETRYFRIEHIESFQWIWVSVALLLEENDFSTWNVDMIFDVRKKREVVLFFQVLIMQLPKIIYAIFFHHGFFPLSQPIQSPLSIESYH